MKRIAMMILGVALSQQALALEALSEWKSGYSADKGQYTVSISGDKKFAEIELDPNNCQLDLEGTPSGICSRMGTNIQRGKLVPVNTFANEISGTVYRVEGTDYLLVEKPINRSLRLLIQRVERQTEVEILEFQHQLSMTF